MIILKKLLKEIDEDKNANIASVEDESQWKWPDVEHMFAMKFDREGDSVFVLRNPAMKVYKIKNGPFILEEPVENHIHHDPKKGMESPMKAQGLLAFKNSKNVHRHEFPNFIKLINFFDSYEQES